MENRQPSIRDEIIAHLAESIIEIEGAREPHAATAQVAGEEASSYGDDDYFFNDGNTAERQAVRPERLPVPRPPATVVSPRLYESAGRPSTHEKPPLTAVQILGRAGLVIALGGLSFLSAVQIMDNENSSREAVTTVAPPVKEKEKTEKLQEEKSPAEETPITPETSEPSPSEKPKPFALVEPSPSAELAPEVISPEKPPKYLRNATVLYANVLGHNHTAPKGNKTQFAGSKKRTKLFVDVIKSNDVDLGGAGEFQGPQQKIFDELAGDTYDRWPKNRNNAQNSVFWKDDMFDLVNGRYVKMPYFKGKLRKYPLVRLRSTVQEGIKSAQDIFVLTIHNPASIKRLGKSQKRFREEATRIQKELVKHLDEKFGLPLVVLGDANAKRSYVCEMTNSGILESAAGGSNGPNKPCRVPKGVSIDHILGSGVEFGDYEQLDGPKVQKLTDHKGIYIADMVLPNPER